MNILQNHIAEIFNGIDPSRSLAIDVFRGLTITAMILVNNPGSWSYIYWPLAHSEWHGWTPTDLIFPFFILIIGMSLSFSMKHIPENISDKFNALKKAYIRGGKLFALGLLIAIFYYNVFDPTYDWWTDRVEHIRILGVLQRLGLVFALTAGFILFFSKKSLALISVLLLIIYSVAMMLVPYYLPDGTRAVGLWAYGNNLAAAIDLYVLSADHVYYQTASPFAFDPEGLLSTIPAVSGCIFGYFIGLHMQKGLPATAYCKHYCLLGIALVAISYLLAPFIPINKALWTPSYVILSTGMGLLCLAMLSYVLDEKQWRAWSAPFIVFGANALLFYVGSQFAARILVMIPIGFPIGSIDLQTYVYSRILQPILGNYNGSLAFAILFLVLSYAIMHRLYKKNIFWKV